MKKILLAVFTLALALGSSMPVYAATQTTTMPVSVTIAAAVTVSANGLNFGTVAPNASQVGNATITVNAANDTPYTVTLDAGLNPYNTDYRRVVSGGTNYGNYYLYTDPSSTTQWGDMGFAGTIVGSGVAGTGNGAGQTLTVYGLFTAALTPGVYTDTVTVTVNY